MAARYSYFSWEGIPCRIAMEGELYGEAEMFRQGIGFVPAPFSEIMYKGRAISKSDFEKLVLDLSKAARSKDLRGD
jgi:hypothetical protein